MPKKPLPKKNAKTGIIPRARCTQEEERLAYKAARLEGVGINEWTRRCVVERSRERVEPNPKDFRVELGKRYERRDGEISGVIEELITGVIEELSGPSVYLFWDPEHRFSYTETGAWYTETGAWRDGKTNPWDLIREYKG